LLCLTLTASLIAPVSVAKIRGGQTKKSLGATAYTQESSASSQQKALTLLDQLLNQTKDFGDGVYSPMKVILFQAKATNLLWDYDQSRARSLFTTAMKSAVLLRPKVEGMKVGLDSDDALIKQMILNLVLPCDSAFAEQLARLVLESYPQR